MYIQYIPRKKTTLDTRKFYNKYVLICTNPTVYLPTQPYATYSIHQKHMHKTLGSSQKNATVKC